MCANDNEFVQVMTTAETKNTLEKIGKLLIRKNLAACVQLIGPIESMYRWQGKIHHDQEWLALIKSRSVHFTQIERIILQNHNYDTPEIIALPLTTGEPKYLDWIRQMTPRDTSKTV